MTGEYTTIPLYTRDRFVALESWIDMAAYPLPPAHIPGSNVQCIRNTRRQFAFHSIILYIATCVVLYIYHQSCIPMNCISRTQV